MRAIIRRGGNNIVTVLTETSATEVAAQSGESHSKDELWLSAIDTTEIIGWSMKPEGFCKDDVCVPTPSGRANFLCVEMLLMYRIAGI